MVERGISKLLALMYCKASPISDLAKEFAERNFKVYYEDTEPRYDILISFLNGYIIPKETIDKCDIALNFHTCPPAYPGTGGYSLAIFNRDDMFGVTCHHLDEKIDHGEIIEVEWFELLGTESILGLLHRAHIESLRQFYRIMTIILNDQTLPTCDYGWGREIPYTRKDLWVINNKLREIRPEVFE